MRYTGLFFAREPKALMGLLDAPYAVMGRHALCAHDSACDGGAMACAVGRIRNGQALARELADAGMRVKREGGLSALVLAAYRLWGEDYPAKLEGPVGTAVIDQDAGRLVLSRVAPARAVRVSIRIGEEFDLQRGASGKVLLAFGEGEE
ncbi:MAG: hypothetical protein RR843_05225, partial [Clostridia bacterium]